MLKKNFNLSINPMRDCKICKKHCVIVMHDQETEKPYYTNVCFDCLGKQLRRSRLSFYKTLDWYRVGDTYFRDYNFVLTGY